MSAEISTKPGKRAPPELIPKDVQKLQKKAARIHPVASKYKAELGAKGVTEENIKDLVGLGDKITTAANSAAGRRLVVPGLTQAENEAFNALVDQLTDIREGAKQEKPKDKAIQKEFLVGKALGRSFGSVVADAGLIAKAAEAHLSWLSPAGVTAQTVQSVRAGIASLSGADAAQRSKLAVSSSSVVERKAHVTSLRAAVLKIKRAASRAFKGAAHEAIRKEFATAFTGEG